MHQFLRILFFSSLLLVLAWRILDTVTSVVVYVRFKELRPLPTFVNVLYKGVKIGRVISIKHSEDYEYTILKLRLHPRTLNLPENVVAKLMIEKRRFRDYDYINIEKPEIPSEFKLKPEMYIEGITLIDSKTYLANQKKEDLEGIKENFYQASESLLTTIDGLSSLISILQESVVNNNPNINKLTNELATSAKNLSELTSKINSGVNLYTIENSFEAIESTLQNIDESSNVVKKSLPVLLDESIKSLGNINEITSSVSSKLNSPLGGLRLLFGGKNRCY